MKTYLPTDQDVAAKSYLVDATGKTLGRLATRVASLLIGKGKAAYAPDRLCGDQVVVVNAKSVYVTGKKRTQKIYKHYSGYPGGQKTYRFEELQARKPEEIILRAVRRMLPKNKLGREMLRRLRVYGGGEHSHRAQRPVPLEV